MYMVQLLFWTRFTEGMKVETKLAKSQLGKTFPFTGNPFDAETILLTCEGGVMGSICLVKEGRTYHEIKARSKPFFTNPNYVLHIHPPRADGGALRSDLRFRDNELVGEFQTQYSNEQKWRLEGVKGGGHVLNAIRRNRAEFIEDMEPGLYLGARLIRKVDPEEDTRKKPWKAQPVGVGEIELAQKIRLWCSQNRYCLIQLANSELWLCSHPSNPIMMAFCDQPQNDFLIHRHAIEHRPQTPSPPPSKPKRRFRSVFKRYS